MDKAKQQEGDLLDNAIRENVLRVVEQLKSSPPILASELRSGRLEIVGARYRLDTGEVDWLGGRG